MRVQYDPRLDVPLELGTQILAASQYGEVVRGVPSGGEIKFSLGRGNLSTSSDPEMWVWLARLWKGREFRVYLGDPLTDDTHEDLSLVYTGRIDDLTHDTLTASVKTTGVAQDLDGPIVSELYPDDDDTPEAIRGRPKPELRGQGNCLAPVLIEEATQTYQVSRLALDEITEVRVGGVPWDEVDSDPEPGEWSADLDAGTFQLGGVTLGGEVRCDAKATGWEDLTTAVLFRELVEEGYGVVDEASMAALEAQAPWLIGWYTTTEAVNRLEALDQIMQGVGGYWTETADATLVAGLLAAPSTSASLNLTDVGVQSLRLSGIIPPAWRIRVEHSRNWQPQTSFFESVSEADQQLWSEEGKVAPAFESQTIKDAEPRAIDVPLIRSLVLDEDDAIAIRDRLSTAWGVERRVYEISATVDAPDLYSTVDVDYMMVSGNFRVHSVIRSFGGGVTQLTLWG